MAKVNEPAVTEKPMNPWAEMKEVYLVAKTRSEQPTEYFNVNGRKYFVPKGVVTRVPKPIYDLIQNRVDAENTLNRDAKKNFTGDRVPTFGL